MFCPAFDYHIAMMSLPRRFGTTLSTIPSGASPYLQGAKGSHRRVAPTHTARPPFACRPGMVGKSGAQTTMRNAHLGIESMRPLLEFPGIRFHALQKEVREEDAELLTHRCRALDPLGPEFKDFSDTAAAINQLDLVITVDTSVAHLAAALGKPVWILLPHAADWRWLTGREDSPWYPTVRLFRFAFGESAGANVKRVRAALKDIRKARRTSRRP
jgi:hypothetical protein